jgi:lipoprotein-releasing system permease protein
MINLPFWIARKYFLSKKKKGFINFIAIISMLGLALGTAALIIILSVFNGLEDLNRQVFKAFDPDLKISSKTTKYFEASPKILTKIKKIEGIAYVSEILQEKALARSNDAQMIVVLKGIDSTFNRNQDLKKSIVEGKMSQYKGNLPQVFIGAGVYYTLDLVVDDYLRPLNLLFPKNQAINVLNPEDNINTRTFDVSGAFALEVQYDNYVYAPLKEVEALCEAENKRTSYDIILKPEAEINKIKQNLAEIMGANYSIKTRDEQNAALFKAIKVEKLFIFVALFFIMAIASFNIFYGLSMLVLDKKDDVFTLASLGASQSQIRNIFLIEGLIIGIVGVLVGSFIGLSVCLIQQKWGVVSLGMQYAMVNSYPVKIQGFDIFISIFGILFLALMASILPANKALNFMKIR